jgi:hypothetical protein
MLRAEHGLVLGDAAVEVGFLLAQGAERRIARHLGDIGDLVRVEARLAERDQAAFLSMRRVLALM